MLDWLLNLLAPRRDAPLARHDFGIDPRQPIGVYSGQPPLPATPRVTLTEQLLDSLRGDPGIRLSESTARNRRYTGTDAIATPSYPTGPPRANRPEHLEVAPLTSLPSRHGGLV